MSRLAAEGLAGPASFGLSPRASRAVVRNSSGGTPANGAAPRSVPSPRVDYGWREAKAPSYARFPQPDASGKIEYHHHQTAAAPPSSNEASPAAAVASGKRRGSVAAVAPAAFAYDSSSHASHSYGGGGWGKPPRSRSPSPSHNGRYGQSGPLSRDEDSEELRIWRQQQKLLDIQQRNLALLKYGLGTTLGLLLLLMLWLIAGAGRAPTTPTVMTPLQLNAAPGELVGAPGAPLTPLEAAAAAAAGDEWGFEDAARVRRETAELTAKLAEAERRELLELDASNMLPEGDVASDPRATGLNPVQRAKARIPPPPMFAPLGDPHSWAASRVKHYEGVMGDNAADETPEMLRQLAERARAEALYDQTMESLRRSKRHGHAGDSDDDLAMDGGLASAADAQVRVAPPPPASAGAAHVTIETLIHAHTPEGATPRAHGHKEHPGVPKFGRAPSRIPMPPPEKDPRSAERAALMAAAKAAQAAAAASAAPTEEQPSLETLATPAAAAPLESAPAAPVVPEPIMAQPVAMPTPALVESVYEAPAAAPAPVAPAAAAPVVDDSDDMLSELMQASSPSQVSQALDSALSAANKASGLKGPVQRGANAQAAQLGELVDSRPTADVAQAPSSASSSASAASASRVEKPVLPVREPLSAADRKRAELEWSMTKGRNLGELRPWSPAPVEEGEAGAVVPADQLLFGDDVQVIVLTSLKQQSLARKIKALYGPYIKRLLFISDGTDRGLNATVLSNPHPDYTARNDKVDSPWRIYELFRMLLDPARRPHGKPADFYLVLHDQTFALLDQVRWRLERYRDAWQGRWPNFVGGRKTQQKFDKAFWTEQQEAAAKVFEGKKLFAVPSYMWGFDLQFLSAVSDFTSADSCPVLSTEGLALAGLVECAGGALDQTEYDFVLQTRSNHREKKIDKDAAPLSVWRQFDAFHGCNTPGMLQEAWDAYYGKLKPSADEADDE